MTLEPERTSDDLRPESVEPDETITTGEVVKLVGFGLTLKQVRGLIKRGDLPAVRVAEERGWNRVPLAAALKLREQLRLAAERSSAGPDFKVTFRAPGRQEERDSEADGPPSPLL